MRNTNTTKDCGTLPAAKQQQRQSRTHARTMAVGTAAERNRRKRERKKRTAAEAWWVEPKVDNDDTNNNVDNVEIDYVAAPLAAAVGLEEGAADALEAVRRFQARVAVVSSDEADGVSSELNDETNGTNQQKRGEEEDDDAFNEDDDEDEQWSKRKMRDIIRPTVAELKRRVDRPDLVEAHDVTAADPEFLIRLKGIPGTVPVPRHWGRKRKYLQGKRGFEKPPFRLPQFLINTGITELRDTVLDSENSMSAKQKNRSRVQVKLGAIDVDYRTLHDAFFKHQTKPTGLTRFGDLYYEGKELEIGRNIVVGQPLTAALRAALAMSSPGAPPPWLINMQRYGPPPSYPSLKIPGLNAPLPDPTCQYGYHPNGWGKPPVDAYGRPLYGGNPFDPPGSGKESMNSMLFGDLVTSDGKALAKADWGSLPTGLDGERDDDAEMDESSEEEMEESSDEEPEEVEEGQDDDGAESMLPTSSFPSHAAPVDLRKTGMETPVSVGNNAAPKQQLYTVLEQRQATTAGNAVFASTVAYTVPTNNQVDTAAAAAAGGAESVLSKALPAKDAKKRNRQTDDDDDDDDEALSKNFKF